MVITRLTELRYPLLPAPRSFVVRTRYQFSRGETCWARQRRREEEESRPPWPRLQDRCQMLQQRDRGVHPSTPSRWSAANQFNLCESGKLAF